VIDLIRSISVGERRRNADPRGTSGPEVVMPTFNDLDGLCLALTTQNSNWLRPYVMDAPEATAR
jgi:hypothetical protein